MPTVNQLVRRGRKRIVKKTRTPVLRFQYNALKNRTKQGKGATKTRRLPPGKNHDPQEA